MLVGLWNVISTRSPRAIAVAAAWSSPQARPPAVGRAFLQLQAQPAIDGAFGKRLARAQAPLEREVRLRRSLT
jgi:hypothetical protein